MYTIELTVPERSPIVVRVADEPLRLGLDPANDVVLEDPQRSVSRFHAELRVEDGRLVLVDLNSESGSFVNGRRVSRAELDRASVGQLGAFRLRVLQGPAGVGAASGGKVSARRVSSKVAWLPRLALAGGFLVLALLAVVMGRWFATFDSGSKAAPTEAAGAGSGTEPTPAEPPSLPPSVESRLGSAQAALDAGELEAAREHVQAVLAEAPDQTEALALQARLDELEREAQARAAVAAAPEPAPPPPAAPRRPAARRPAPEPALTGIERDLKRMYDNAVAAAERGELRLAISNLQAVLNIDENYLDAKARHAALVGEGNAAIDREIEAAEAAEAQGEPAKAVAAYRRAVELAERLDVALTGVEAAIEKNQSRMIQAGHEAYRQARQYDALGRSADAIALYRRAIELLPEGDANRQTAEERLAALR